MSKKLVLASGWKKRHFLPFRKVVGISTFKPFISLFKIYDEKNKRKMNSVMIVLSKLTKKDCLVSFPAFKASKSGCSKRIIIYSKCNRISDIPKLL